jgi:hypothetical protein
MLASIRAKSITWLVMLSCLLFAYVAVRAVVVPITWDEAFNYLEFTRKGVLLPFGHFRAMAANNHYLNTWLTYLATAVLGVSELTLRLPALMAYALFLYYTARLCNELSSPLLRVSAFIVLNGNPYVLDFFALSRGYGLAYGLLAGSLWYLYRFFQADLQVRYSRASLGFAIVAVAAHLTLIHFLISLMVVVVLATILFAPAGSGFFRRVSDALRVNVVSLAAVGLSLVPVAFVVRKLRHAHAFFYGGATSFWHDTILGVFDASLYGKQYSTLLGPWLGTPSFRLSDLLGFLAILLMAIALWVSIRCVGRHRQPRELYQSAVVFLVCSCAFASVAQHHLLGVRYLAGRTGMYLLILGTFVLVMLADAMARTSGKWRYGLPAGAALVTLHLINCLNLTYAFEWKLDADVKHMLADIAVARDATRGVERPTVLGVNLEFEAPINFYRRVDGLTWLNPADRKMKLHPLSDFYLYSEDDWGAVTAESFVVLKTYPLNSSRLVRRKWRPSQYVRFERTLDFDAPADSMTTLEATSEDAAFSGRRSGMTDARHRRSGRITYTPDVTRDAAERSLVAVEAMVWMNSLRNATAQVVVAFERNEKPYSRQTLTVQDGARRARTWLLVKLTAFVPPGVQQGDRVSVYLENNGDLVYVDDLEMRWISTSPPPRLARDFHGGDADRGPSQPECCQSEGSGLPRALPGVP